MVFVLRKKTFIAAVCFTVFIITAILVFPVFGKEISLPVIMYHHISEKPSLLGTYVISPEEFENDIKYLKDSGYTSVSAKQLLHYIKKGGAFPEKPVMITFDDGFESFYTYAMPILKKYGFRAVIAVVGSYTDKFTEANDHNVDYSYLTWEEIEEISKCGYVEIANHTYDLHTTALGRNGCSAVCGEDFECYKEKMSKDILRFQKMLERHTGSKTRIFAYPFGFWGEQSDKVLKDFKFDIAFTCSEKVNVISSGFNMRCVGRFNRPHGIPTWKFFERIKQE